MASSREGGPRWTENVTVSFLTWPLVIILLLVSSTDVNSSRPRTINGVCGSADGVLSVPPPSSNLCTSGTTRIVIQRDDTWYWQCNGSGWHSTSSSCSSPAIPVIVISFSPATPSISSDSPGNTLVSTVSAVWSDGSEFTGTFQFAAPYSDDGGVFSLVNGNQIVVTMDDGLVGDGNTTQNITIEATQ